MTCPAIPPAEGDSERQRTAALPVPQQLAGVATADRDWFAVATLGGKTVCVDTIWMDSIEEPSLSADGRFLAFAWSGYEAYGYVLVDRTGAGQAVETGERPRPSPTGNRLASVEYSESGFGSLNGLGVWQIEPEELRELAIVEFPPDYTDWRFEKWVDERCLVLSAATFHDVEVADYNLDKANRHAFVAREAAGWQAEPGGGESCSVG